MKSLKALIILALITMPLVLATCKSKTGQDGKDRTASLPTIKGTHEFPDTHIVGTIYSPAGFCTLKGDN